MPRVVLRGGMVFDGTGCPPFRSDVVVEGGDIVDVGVDLDGDDEVDVHGMTVLPGLIDSHIHSVLNGTNLMQIIERPFSYQFYLAAANLEATLSEGVTTARDAGGADLGIVRALHDGLIDGPDLLIAITPLGQTGGHTDGWTTHGEHVGFLVPHPGRPAMVVDGPHDMRVRVRELVRAGADVIKICTSGGVISGRDDPRTAHFAPDELAVCVAEASNAGLGVMAHAHAAKGILNAVRAGVASIEHGVYLDDECLDAMLESGTYLVPTLLASFSLLELVRAGAPLPDMVKDKIEEAAAVHRSAFARAVDAGVRIAMGTDSGVTTHGRNSTELALMVDGGMTPLQALTAATSSAAELLKRGQRIGRIAPGFQADLIALAGGVSTVDGFRDRIQLVWKKGVVVRNGDDFASGETVAANVGGE